MKKPRFSRELAALRGSGPIIDLSLAPSRTRSGAVYAKSTGSTIYTLNAGQARRRRANGAPAQSSNGVQTGRVPAPPEGGTAVAAAPTLSDLPMPSFTTMATYLGDAERAACRLLCRHWRRGVGETVTSLELRFGRYRTDPHWVAGDVASDHCIDIDLRPGANAPADDRAFDSSAVAFEVARRCRAFPNVTNITLLFEASWGLMDSKTAESSAFVVCILDTLRALLPCLTSLTVSHSTVLCPFVHISTLSSLTCLDLSACLHAPDDLFRIAERCRELCSLKLQFPKAYTSGRSRYEPRHIVALAALPRLSSLELGMSSGCGGSGLLGKGLAGGYVQDMISALASLTGLTSLVVKAHDSIPFFSRASISGLLNLARLSRLQRLEISAFGPALSLSDDESHMEDEALAEWEAAWHHAFAGMPKLKALVWHPIGGYLDPALRALAAATALRQLHLDLYSREPQASAEAVACLAHVDRVVLSGCKIENCKWMRPLVQRSVVGNLVGPNVCISEDGKHWPTCCFHHHWRCQPAYKAQLIDQGDWDSDWD